MQSVRGEHRVISQNPLEVETDLASIHDRYTPIEDFYVRNHQPIPENSVRPVLRIELYKTAPVRLTPGDLSHLKNRKLSAVLECAGNPVGATGLVSNGMWEGWPLQEVIKLAGRLPGGFVHLFGRDGYARSVPAQRITDGAMLVAKLDGHPLRPHHGAPWRALFPAWYGMDSVKWLERIVVSGRPLPHNEDEYMEVRPAEPVGVLRRPLPRVQVKSVITSPAAGTVVQRGTLEVRGLAWCGKGTVTKVEVSTDGRADWQKAIVSQGDRYDWALWRASLELPAPGRVELVCRATDSLGNMQPERRDPDRLDGYGQNWYHRIAIEIT
jgi:DMSO/TMAO reductase YedYZ molybdopterin-dependent catalytic subunit